MAMDKQIALGMEVVIGSVSIVFAVHMEQAGGIRGPVGVDMQHPGSHMSSYRHLIKR